MEQFGQDPIIPEMQPQDQFAQQDQLAQQHQSAQQQFEQQQQYEQQQQFAQQQFEQQQFEQQQYEQQQFAQQQQQFAQQQYVQPQYAQPGYAQPAYAAPAPAKKKSPFGWISMLVGLLCVVIAGVGTAKALNTSFFNIPAIETLFNISGGQKVLDEYDKFVDEAEEASRLLSEEEIEEFEDEAGISVDEVLEVLRKPSVNSVMDISDAVEEILPEYGGEIASILGFVQPIIIGYGVIIMFFALLAALLKNRTLSIIGIILSLGFFLLLTGIAYLVLYMIVAIAHIVLVSIHKSLKKKY